MDFSCVVFADPLEWQRWRAHPSGLTVEGCLSAPGDAATRAPGVSKDFPKDAPSPSTSGRQGGDCRSSAIRPLRLVACGTVQEGNDDVGNFEEREDLASNLKKYNFIRLSNCSFNLCLIQTFGHYRGDVPARRSCAARGKVGSFSSRSVYLCYALTLSLIFLVIICVLYVKASCQ